MKKQFLLLAIIPTLLLIGCATVSDNRQQVESVESNNLTVGKVQREIRIGMYSAEVIEVLGSPNVVTTDEERREVWIYDRISTDIVYSEKGSYATLIIIGGGGASGTKSTSQRTLTIIIKFDKENKVRDFAYHASRF